MIANNLDINVYFYSVRQPDGFGWGDFYISSTGMVASYTDYENCVYRWIDWGKEDFLRWFVDCIDKNEKHYVLGKMFPGDKHKVIDAGKTLWCIKNHIIECRKDGSWSAKKAREEFDLLDEYGLLDEFDETEYYNWINATTIDDAYDFTCKDYTVSVHMWWDKLMPLLSEKIHKDIDGIVKIQI